MTITKRQPRRRGIALFEVILLVIVVCDKHPLPNLENERVVTKLAESWFEPKGCNFANGKGLMTVCKLWTFEDAMYVEEMQPLLCCPKKQAVAFIIFEVVNIQIRERMAGIVKSGPAARRPPPVAEHIMYVTAVQEVGGPGQSCAFRKCFNDIVLSKEAH